MASIKNWFSKEMGGIINKTRRRGSSKSKTKEAAYEIGDEVGVDEPAYTSFHKYAAVHRDAVTSVAAAGNGICLSGSKDQTVGLFDFNTGLLKYRWMTHSKDITKVAHAKVLDGYLSASRDTTVHFLKENTSQPVMIYGGHDLVVTALSLNKDNSQVCTGSRDNSVKIWDVGSGQCVNSKTISRNLVTHVHWVNNMIAQSGEDKEMRIYDSRTLDVMVTFPRKQYIQTWCELSMCGNYLLSSSNGFGGSGCEATLWDVRGKSIVHEFRGHHESCCCVIFLPSHMTGDGPSLIATSGNDSTVKVWNRDTKECVGSKTLSGAGPLTSMTTFDDNRVAVASFNRGVQVLLIKPHPTGVHMSRSASF